MIGLREYSRYRGVSLAAVQSAIDSGRLTTSVTRDKKGTRKLVSIEAADAEWQANTRPVVGHPATTPPTPARPHWPPPWAPEWVHELEWTPDEALSAYIEMDALAIALARLLIEHADDRARAIGDILERLAPIIGEGAKQPRARMTLAEALEHIEPEPDMAEG